MSALVALERSEGVALVRLDRPKANALSVELLGELESVFDALASDLPGAVVVTGSERIFSAGAEIAELDGPEGARRVVAAFAGALERIARLPRATVAAVRGAALGGGLELALACDLRVVGASSRFGQPEVLLGLLPGAGGTQRLARLVGPGRAKDLVLTGRQVGADEALSIGLADRVVEDASVLDEAMSLAASLARGPLVAHSLAKRAIDEGLELSLADGLELERRLFVRVFETRDASIGVRSFLEQGPGAAEFVGA